jgi:hypothetical protein
MADVAGVMASDKGEVRSTIHKVFVGMCYLLYALYPHVLLLFSSKESSCA